MAPFVLIVAALIAPLALAVPTPGNTYGTGGSAPAGWDASVENFCSTPEFLECCNGTGIAGVAGEPTATNTGCELLPPPCRDAFCLTQINRTASHRYQRHGGWPGYLRVWLLPLWL